MSAGILQRLQAEGELTIEQIADLLNLQAHSVYPYLSSRELRYSQLRTLMRHSGRSRVAQAFLADLLTGTSWVAHEVDHHHLDADGDGDVDTQDAVRSAAKSLRTLADFVERFADATPVDDHLAQAADQMCQEAIQSIATARRIIAHLHDKTKRRRKARPLSVGMGVQIG